MKKFYIISIFILSIFFFTGCAELLNPTTVTSSTPGTIVQQQMEAYNGPKAKVAVMRFDNKTGIHVKDEIRATSSGVERIVGDPIGEGMVEQLTTALAQTGAFIVLERQAIQDIIKEQDFGASGRVRQDTAATIGEIEGADFLIYGAVTEYKASQASAQAGVGTRATGGSIAQNALWMLAKQAVGAAFNQDHVAIDIRLVDARTGRIINATSIEGKPRELDGFFGGMFGNTLVGLSGSYSTPLQKAVRACMIKAVNWIAQNTLHGGVVHASTQTVTPGQQQPIQQTAQTPPSTAPVQGSVPVSPLMLTVSANKVNVRLQPDPNSMVLTTVTKDTKVEKIGQQGDWVNIRLSNGITGWVMSDLVR